MSIYKTPKGFVKVSEDEIKIGDYVYSSWSLPEKCVFCVAKIKERSYIDQEGYEHPFTNSHFITKKIIASTFKLGDITILKMSEAEEILKSIGYDNDSITSTEKWIAVEVNKKANAYSYEELRLALYAMWYRAKDGEMTIEEALKDSINTIKK